MRKLLAAVAFVLALPACSLAQPVASTGLQITSIVGGGNQGLMNTAVVDSDPDTARPENRLYADTDRGWPLNAFPTKYTNAVQIRALDADRATTGDTMQNRIVANIPTCVTVWHADAQVDKPTWLTTGFTETVDNAQFDDRPGQEVSASGWVAEFDKNTNIDLGGNCPIGGCTGTPMMYAVSIRPHYLENCDLPVASPGNVAFVSSSYGPQAESTTLTFQVTRAGGSSGSCSVTIAEGTNPSNGTLNTTSLSWSSGESGAKSGTVDLAAVSGNTFMTLDLSSPSGCALGSPTSTTLNISDTTAPTAAQTFYISSSDGNDADDGLSEANAWLTLCRANTVQAHASGHVDILIEPGNYRLSNACLVEPQNSGTDTTHRIRYGVDTTEGAGVVNILGPASGEIRDAIIIEGRQWIEFMRTSATSYLKLDGEVIFGTGAGQVEKFEPVLNFGHIQEGFFCNDSQNITIDMDFVRQRGWTGLSTGYDSAIYGDGLGFVGCSNLVIRSNGDQIGTPYDDVQQDYSDFMYVSQYITEDKRILLDGGTTGRSWNRGGHATLVMYGGTGTLRNYTFDGLWGGVVSTFTGTDGNRGTQFGGRESMDWHAYNVIWQRGGKPADQSRVECTKLEGTRTSISDSIIRNCHHNAFEISTATWSGNARGLRFSHMVIEHIPGLIISLRDYACCGDPGESIPNDIRGYNVILKNVNHTPALSQFQNVLMDVNLNSGNWLNVLFLKGWTVQDATRDGDDWLLCIWGGGAPGCQTVNYYTSNHPNNFASWTFTTDANLDNAPAAGVFADITAMTTEYALVSDTLSTGTGVDLTTTTGAGSSSTNLCVNDITWFENPVDGAPGVGQHSEGFFVHIDGVGNRQYTALTRDPYPQIDGCFTLSVASTWANGAAVNKKISSGGASDNPNRGLAR